MQPFPCTRSCKLDSSVHYFVQLLSLHGKAEVLVERLQLTVIEDHGGTGLLRYSLFS